MLTSVYWSNYFISTHTLHAFVWPRPILCMAPQRLTLHFIAAMIFFVEILYNTQCSSSWYHILPNATALFFHFNEFVTIPAAFMVRLPLPSLLSSVSLRKWWTICLLCLFYNFFSNLLKVLHCLPLKHPFGTTAHAFSHFLCKKKQLSSWFDVFFTFPCGFRQSTWSQLNFLLFKISCFRFQELTWLSLAWN